RTGVLPCHHSPSCGAHPHLHSVPTRRSSDLNGSQCLRVRSIWVVHAELHVLFECFWTYSTNLEVHHCVVSTAHFRTAAYESAFFSDFGNLEAPLLLVSFWVSVGIALEQEFRHPEGVGYVAGSQTELNWSVGWQNQDWNLFGGAQGFDLVVVQVRKVTHRTSVDWVRVLHVFWVYRS